MKRSWFLAPLIFLSFIGNCYATNTPPKYFDSIGKDIVGFLQFNPNKIETTDVSVTYQITFLISNDSNHPYNFEKAKYYGVSKSNLIFRLEKPVFNKVQGVADSLILNPTDQAHIYCQSRYDADEFKMIYIRWSSFWDDEKIYFVPENRFGEYHAFLGKFRLDHPLIDKIAHALFFSNSMQSSSVGEKSNTSYSSLGVFIVIALIALGKKGFKKESSNKPEVVKWKLGQKICPKCNKIYDDSWAICMDDNQALVERKK